MDIETGLFFAKMPQALPLYKMFAEKVLAVYPDVQIKIHKSQISFSNKYQFAFVLMHSGRGLISMKHAAVNAGLGTLKKNSI
ncbi:MAG: hypothetical protein KAY70_05155 [Acetobacterium sp.]|nr:hypothetical protein [Acetobacterium sp.]